MYEQYGLELESEKGLFTFYREQQQAQSCLKTKISAEHLQKILGKVIRMNSSEKKKPNHDKIKDKSLLNRRQTSKAHDSITPQSSSIVKRQELKLKKSIIEQPKHIKPDFQNHLKPQAKYIKNIANTANTQIHHNQSPHNEESSNKESFKKYMSDFDTIRLKKKAIFQESLSLKNQKQQNKSFSPQNKKKQVDDERTVQISKNKLILHFKKMALQPQEFSGMINVDKNFGQMSLHKKQKSGLKSYRKQKLRQSDQKRALDFSQRKNDKPTDKSKEKYSVFDKQTLKNNILPVESVREQNVKLIRVQKISKKPQPMTELEKTLIDQVKPEEISCKLGVNLPQISNRYRQINNGTSMSLELMKSHQLKSKYQMREVEKEEEDITNINQKLRLQLKYIRNSPKKIQHFISMNTTPNNGLINSQRQISSITPAQTPHKDSIQLIKAEQLSFKKQKQIFCKRDDYLKGYTKKVRRNLISLEKQDELKIRSLLQEKKREIIENLMDKLSFI